MATCLVEPTPESVEFLQLFLGVPARWLGSLVRDAAVTLRPDGYGARLEWCGSLFHPRSPTTAPHLAV